MQFKRSDFPDGFVFGAATSAYQIEGHGFGGAGSTHWDTFAATPGNVVGAENGARACDHYHRYAEDLDLLKGGNFDAYRFSTSWARVQPEGRGAGNAEGLDFYDRLVDAVLARGLKPAATLYHWELPSPLADLGGWANRDIAGRFADFTETVMRRIGDRLWSAAPVNEPWCVAWLSHFLGNHAPGLRDIRAATRAMHHVLLAHGRAIGVMRGLGMGNLGCVNNHDHVEPADDTAEAAEAAQRFDSYANRAFLDPMLKGAYPADLLADIGAHLPAGWQADMDTIAAPLDWYGLNYYTRKLVRPAPGPWPALEVFQGDLPKTQMGWEVYPDGLYRLLERIHADYDPALPIRITENGMASDDRVVAGRIEDPQRIDYIDAHLDAVRRAIAAGVPVQGYFAWSLLDNFEWAYGYAKRFGLVHVDFESLQRTPKASYEALKCALSQ